MVSEMKQSSEVRTHLGHRQRLLPVQIALLPYESALLPSTPHAHDHITSRQIRALISFALEGDLGPFWHASVNVQDELRIGVDDPMPLALGAEVLDLAPSSTALIAVHLHLLEDSWRQLMPHETDTSALTGRAVDNVLL